MKFLMSMICVVLAIVVLTFIQKVAAPLVGLEKTIVEISSGVIAAVCILGFFIFSIAGQLDGPERCDECGRPTDPRLAYREEPNTKNPPCRECRRPLPDSQFNA